MAGRLTLTKYQVANVSYLTLGAYRLRVEASDPRSSGADPNVFLYQQRPPNPYNGEVLSDYLGVAGPVDMTEYPVGVPREGTTFPIFRLDFFEIDLRGVDQAREAWLIAVEEVSRLLTAFDALERLEPETSVELGTPEGGSSSSSSA